MRKKTRQIKVGNVLIGDGSPVAVQSMTNTDTEDITATLFQAQRLHEAGCELIRVSFPTEKSLRFIKEYKRNFKIPLIGDIHFDYQLAIKAIEEGVDKIRINPGNIGSEDKVRKIINVAKNHKVPIRIGVNGGSLPPQAAGESDLLPVTRAAIDYIRLFEDEEFFDIVISVKTSDVLSTIRAYSQVADYCNYPLHVGITEAGVGIAGTIKSAVGIGSILSNGIGDTIRVSLTGDPVQEVVVARQIIQSLKIRRFGPEIIACPTCSRTKVDLEKLACEVEQRLARHKSFITVAVMGCAVNGPGEAQHADFGVACGNKEGLLFCKGKVVKKVPESRIIDELMAIINSKEV